MTFPTPFTVDHYEYLGGPDNLDELGNEVQEWAATPKRVAVQGWQAIAKEKLGLSEQGVIADTAMSVPPGWLPGIHDRIGLPDGLYEVIEFDIQDSGFHGWKPGNIVRLKKATGI